MPHDPSRCLNQRTGCAGIWEERMVPVSGDDVIQSMEPFCPDMTIEDRAARPLHTIDTVTELTCPVCGTTGRRIRYRRLESVEPEE